jgi:hypothetical protein
VLVRSAAVPDSRADGSTLRGQGRGGARAPAAARGPAPADGGGGGARARLALSPAPAAGGGGGEGALLALAPGAVGVLRLGPKDPRGAIGFALVGCVASRTNPRAIERLF